MFNYKVQNGCNNCGNCFVFQEYDCKDEFYCNIEDDRPLSSSHLLDEGFSKGFTYGAKGNHIDEYMARVDKWNRWAGRYKVSPAGICDNWRERNESNQD